VVLCILDNYLRFIWVYFLVKKYDVFETFKGWRAQVKTQTENKIKALNIRVRYLRSDNGGEYTSKEFRRYCKEDRILRHLTTVYTPEPNAVVEWLNRTVLEKVRYVKPIWFIT
jgi:transposase InsO family protein